MFTKDFERITDNWNELLKESAALFEEGHIKFLEASKSYFDSLKFFSEITGNFSFSQFFENLSNNIESYNKKYEKK